jgi:quercetin dioxygenase-like cupin family protein
MIEKIYPFSLEKGKLIERLVGDDQVMINHITLCKGDTLAEHFSDSNVYLIVTKGTLSLQLDQQKRQDYGCGTLVNIPFHIKMNIGNDSEPLLEFFIVKAPHPRMYKELSK